MLDYLPKIYSHEMIYSFIARYHKHTGNNSTTQTINDLYGTANISISLDLPTNLHAISSHLPNGLICISNLIFNHTPFYFYTSFLSREKTNAILNIMKYGTSIDIHNYIGVKTSNIKFNKYLKFCPICMEYNFKQYGETYWNYIFQIPGIKYCLKHKVKLCDSMIPTQSKYKYAYIAADKNNCIKPKKLECMIVKSHHYSIYKLMSAISHSEQTLFHEAIRTLYFNSLLKKDLAYPSGMVKQKELEKSFISFYGNQFLSEYMASVNINNPDNWLRKIVRKPRNSFYPLFHLLVINFLGMNMDTFISKLGTLKNTKANNSTYPYLNPACYNYTNSKKKDIIISKKLPQEPQKTCNTPKGKSIINWPLRDKILLNEIKIAIHRILYDHTPPVRITIDSIGKYIGKRSMLQNQLDKLPLTKEYLTANTENMEDYYKRKILWLFKNDDLLKKPNISSWDVIRKAHVNKNYYTVIKPYVEYLLNKSF